MRDALVVLPSVEPVDARLFDALARLGARVTRVTRAPEAEHVLHSRSTDVAVLDAALATEELMLRLRRRYPTVARVAWLRGASSDRTAGLLAGGADEVLDAAMGDAELGQRLQLAVRRRLLADGDRVLVGELELDAGSGEATWAGQPLSLTPRELEVLETLARAAGRTVRREVLYRQVWGSSMARGDRSVDVNVKRLRDKLAAARVAVEIKTQPGAGYRLEIAPARDAVTAS